MIYSELYLKKNIKLPTIVGFLIIFFIAVFFSESFLNSTRFSQASIKVAKRVEVVNLTASQVNIFWQTDQAETGWIAYGNTEGSENNIVLDEKDLNNQGDTKGKYKVHVAILKELTADKKYFFKIVSNNNQIIAQPDGSSFNFSTPQSSIQNIGPVYGKILKPDAINPLINSYVILSVVGKSIYPLFADVKDDGSWLIPLNQIYSKDNQVSLTLSNKEKIKIEIITSEGQETIITTFITISPLPQTIPTIVFGTDHNFGQEDNVLSASTDLTNFGHDQINIIYPKEGALIPGKIPLIKGLSLPKTVIEITVNSKKTYSAIVTSDSHGHWSYVLPDDLELGPHTITLKTKDRDGKSIIIQRKFTIIAQQGNEGRVLGTATAEPTIVSTDTPAPTEILNTPTTGLYPTLPTNITLTPEQLKKAGSNFSGTIFSSLSLIVIGGGILLAF